MSVEANEKSNILYLDFFSQKKLSRLGGTRTIKIEYRYAGLNSSTNAHAMRT